ncbi:carboxypeptidase-like regulatory domain-containing protein [Hymenobacter sp. RP-2-7]|uniref:Carboxypeptidase-like regulatory domain-containing protein n=1 Tax=Hymenobacter polaris TaxID=2682546 RepID=A0A7Y0FL18_9BACT|nr:carboxypeptidase-like regulatory domain-containing protein [Hymenobacter polaris]NML64318.1 carboxypeptidase-like regulatory domain-containing protein [Hymenobacter polaris]
MRVVSLWFLQLRLVLLVLLGAAGLARAQAPATGRVVASGTGAPLPQATVRLATGPASAGTSTDEAGRFTLPLPPGTDPRAARLRVSHLGYQPREVPAAQLGADVVLEEQTYQIGEVTVTAASVRQLLVRTWRLADESLDVAAQDLLASGRRQGLKGIEWVARHPDELREVLQKARFTFQPDGTLKVKIMLFGAKGQWLLDEESRTLTVRNRTGSSTSTDTVVELSADRLVLHDATSGLPNAVYVPAD